MCIGPHWFKHGMFWMHCCFRQESVCNDGRPGSKFYPGTVTSRSFSINKHHQPPCRSNHTSVASLTRFQVAWIVTSRFSTSLRHWGRDSWHSLSPSAISSAFGRIIGAQCFKWTGDGSMEFGCGRCDMQPGCCTDYARCEAVLMWSLHTTKNARGKCMNSQSQCLHTTHSRPLDIENGKGWVALEGCSCSTMGTTWNHPKTFKELIYIGGCCAWAALSIFQRLHRISKRVMVDESSPQKRGLLPPLQVSILSWAKSFIHGTVMIKKLKVFKPKPRNSSARSRKPSPWIWKNTFQQVVCVTSNCRWWKPCSSRKRQCWCWSWFLGLRTNVSNATCTTRTKWTMWCARCVFNASSAKAFNYGSTSYGREATEGQEAKRPNVEDHKQGTNILRERKWEMPSIRGNQMIRNMMDRYDFGWHSWWGWCMEGWICHWCYTMLLRSCSRMRPPRNRPDQVEMTRLLRARVIAKMETPCGKIEESLTAKAVSNWRVRDCKEMVGGAVDQVKKWLGRWRWLHGNAATANVTTRIHQPPDAALQSWSLWPTSSVDVMETTGCPGKGPVWLNLGFVGCKDAFSKLLQQKVATVKLNVLEYDILTFRVWQLVKGLVQKLGTGIFEISLQRH